MKPLEWNPGSTAGLSLSCDTMSSYSWVLLLMVWEHFGTEPGSVVQASLELTVISCLSLPIIGIERGAPSPALILGSKLAFRM